MTRGLFLMISIIPNPVIAIPGSIPIILIVTSLPIIRYNVIMSNCWIGVVGKNGSGKSTVCDHLEAQGFHLISLSDVVRDYANRVSVPHDRDSLTSLANQMKLENGADYFASVALKMIQESDHEKVVFDSVRHPDEIKYLKY